MENKAGFPWEVSFCASQVSSSKQQDLHDALTAMPILFVFCKRNYFALLYVYFTCAFDSLVYFGSQKWMISYINSDNPLSSSRLFHYLGKFKDLLFGWINLNLMTEKKEAKSTYLPTSTIKVIWHGSCSSNLGYQFHTNL